MKPFKIRSDWPRIAGIHADADGTIGVIWLAKDTASGKVYLYDSALFSREVFAVIADRVKGDKGRNKWIPVAWEESAAEVAKKLKDRGCKPLTDGYKDNAALAEVNSREMWESMRTGSFVPGKQNSQWFDETDRFRHIDGGKIPLQGFPLMSATRHAFNQLKRAKTNAPKKQLEYDNRGII